MSTLSVGVHADLDPVRVEWDRLAATQPLPSPFLRSWWLENAAAGALRVLTVTEGDRLVGGAAFEVDTLGPAPLAVERVRCVGQGVLAPDHLDLIAAPEHHLEVARAVLAWLRRPGHRIVDLDGLAATGTLGQVFARFTIERIDAPYAAMPDGPDAYLSGRPGKVRSTVKRTEKRLTREGVTFRTATARDIGEALERLGHLHGTRWQDRSTFLDGWDRVVAAVTAGVRADEVVLGELVAADGSTVAAELDLRVGSRLFFYQAGRRTEREWRGAGSDLRARILRSTGGIDEYDMLRGDEPYKADWATGRRELLRCRFGIGAGAALLGAHRVRTGVSSAGPTLARLTRGAWRSALPPRDEQSG